MNDGVNNIVHIDANDVVNDMHTCPNEIARQLVYMYVCPSILLSTNPPEPRDSETTEGTSPPPVSRTDGPVVTIAAEKTISVIWSKTDRITIRNGPTTTRH